MIVTLIVEIGWSLAAVRNLTAVSEGTPDCQVTVRPNGLTSSSPSLPRRPAHAARVLFFMNRSLW